MGNDKSILEKFTDGVKDLAATATNAASEALKAEQPPLKEEDLAAISMPLAADGFMSDPLLMVPPVALVRARRKKRAAPKRRAARKTAPKTVKKAAKKAAKKPAPAKRKKAASKTRGKTAARKTAKKTIKKTIKKSKKAGRKAARRKR